MWNLVSVCSMTVSVLEQDTCTVCAKHTKGRNHFACIRWYSKLTKLKWKLILVHLEIVINLTQDRCMVCAKCIIGTEIVLDTPDGTSM
jgi:hypothetical protein